MASAWWSHTEDLAPVSVSSELPPLVLLVAPSHCIAVSCSLGSSAGPLDGGRAADLGAEVMDFPSLHMRELPPPASLWALRPPPWALVSRSSMSSESSNDEKEDGQGWNSGGALGCGGGAGEKEDVGSSWEAALPSPLPSPSAHLLRGCAGILWAYVLSVISGGVGVRGVPP